MSKKLKNKTFYAYPKRSKVIAVFFSHGSVVHKSVSPDADGKVSINDQPGVGEAGKVLKGWSIEQKFDTVEAAEAAGKLFHFKEDTDPTQVTGTLMLHAIFEDAIRVTFDTHGAKVIAGKNIKAGDNVEVPNPQEIKKEGYTFQYWYVLEQDEDSQNGQKEVKLETKIVDGVTCFNYQFKKDTIVHAKWKGTEVPFHIVFMAEKRPDQIRPGGEKYAFLGSFTNETDTNKQKTKGIAGSQIIFDDDTASPEKVTSLDKDQFKSYLEEANNTKNLLKYAGSIGVNADSLKGFHVNKEETNKNNPIIEGNGLTTKVVYLDRDTVNLRVFKEGKFVDDETKHPEALGGFKYGQILLEKNENRGWNYLFKTYIKVGNNWRWLGNYEPEYTRSYFSVPPFAVESVPKDGKTAPYMKRNNDNTAWIFEFHDSPTYVEQHGTAAGNSIVLSLPLRLPIDKQGLTYDQAKNWIKVETVENLKNNLLPNSETPLIGRMGEMPNGMYLEPVDYPLSDGYTTINTTIPSATPQQEPPYGRPKGCTPSLKDNDSISKLKTLAGVTDNSKYLVMPIIYKKQNFDLQFDSKEKGNLASKTIRSIPYYSAIVGPAGEEGGDPNSEAKETEVQEYLDKFIPAKVDPDTKEVTNLDEVTKNSQDHLFMGWYLDPGYTIPFNKHMPMPAQNLQVFAKWEPLYHYITVHHLPAGVNGANKPENITELKVPHKGLINTQEDILKNPPILEGRSRADFQGWETYGDVKTEVPSVSGDGGPFLYKFDKPVEKGFHLYPRWYVNKVGVVYAFNYDESNTPLKESEIDNIMKNIDKTQGPITEANRYYMSEYKYPLDSKVRLRAPHGWDAQGKIIEPEAPEGTKAHGKVFLGWKVMYRDKLAPFAWHTVDDLVYYNSEIEFTENNISHKSDAKKGDAIGAMILVAQWGEKKISTKLTLHRNHSVVDATTKEYEIKKLNEEWLLPNVEDSTDLSGFKRENYQFLGWNEEADGSGKMYKPGEYIYIDETHAKEWNHLYAQWEKYYTLEAEKEWIPNKSDYDFKLGLLRWTAPSKSENPDFTQANNFKPVKGSLKSYKTDLEPDGKMKWEVPGLDKNGYRYSYVIVEVKPGMEDAFKNFTSWDQLDVTIDKTLKTKTQIIALTDDNSKVDTFTSATVRNNKIENGKITGYDFEITNEKIVVPKPIITQPYADQNVIVITPGKESDKKVEKVEKIVVTLPDDTILELTKDTNTGHFTTSNNTDYIVTADLTGKLTITLPAGKGLGKGQVITAVAKNAGDVPSEIDSKRVSDAQDSFKIEKPVQEKRDSDYNVVIKANVPQGTTVADGTTFTLTDANGDIIKNGQTPITGTLDKDGHVVFKVADGILTEGQQVQIQTQEPNKNATLSKPSEQLDLTGPVITANDITGKVGIDIEETAITTNEAADITLSSNLPNNLVLGKPNTDKTEWKITGKGEYVTTTTHTVVAVDKFGNKTEKTFTVTITNKDVIDTPVIDDIEKGDTSVKITPPTKGDTLVVTFPSGEVTLTKQNDTTWTANGETYTVTNGKLEVSVPGNGTLNVSDIVTAQGQDSTGKLADSPKVVKSVRQSTKKTPTPQFAKITVGDENFKIKPVDQAGIITDKLVITISNGEQKVKEITLINTKDGWIIEGDDPNNKLELDKEGYIIVSLDGVTLTPKYSFGATGEDTFHGHAISDPTSINVNEKPSEKPTASQGESKENGNPTITGKGEPGADINVYDPTTGNLIAGPVKVDQDGNYEIEVPENALPNDRIVDVKQKEPCKPESEAEKVTISKSVKPLIPAKTEVSVRKVWEGIPTDQAPEAIVYLLKNGKRTGESLKLNEQNNWTGKFENLDTVDEITDQKANVYTVEEELLSGYKTEITGDAKTGFVITNTKENENPNPPVDPENPNPPVDPENPNPPVNPDKPNPPVDPGKPNPPVDPDKPNPPVDPDKPNPPVNPDKPNPPVNPDKPNPPVDPDKPNPPAETDKPNPSIDDNKANSPSGDKTTAGTNNPRTGDEVNVPLYMGLVVVSGSLLLFMELKRRKKQKISEGEDSDLDQKNH